MTDPQPSKLPYFVDFPYLSRMESDPLCADLFPIMSGHHHREFGWFERTPQRVADWVLQYTLNGEGQLEFGKRVQTIIPGDVFILPAGRRNRYRSTPGKRWETLWVHFSGTQVRQWMKALQLLSGPRYPVFHAGIHHDLSDLFHQLIRYMGSDERPFTYLQQTQNCRYLLCRFGEYIQDNNSGASKKRFPLDALRHLMKKNLHTTLSVPDLAREANMSTPHFYRCFKQETGLSPARYFLQMKLTRACELLIREQMTIKEVSEVLGFSSAYHLSKQFKQHLGMPPSEYRRQLME